jgi:hypothetical protein
MMTRSRWLLNVSLARRQLIRRVDARIGLLPALQVVRLLIGFSHRRRERLNLLICRAPLIGCRRQILLATLLALGLEGIFRGLGRGLLLLLQAGFSS